MSAENETARLEAFSDGVFAIAITLLVLDIKVPLGAENGLGRALLAQWPNYFAYVTSFLTILVMWVNHHRLFQQIRRSDHWVLILNGLLLMGVTLVPFPTSLLAEYILHPADTKVAAAVYCGLFVLLALFFNLLWRYAVHQERLLDDRSDRQAVRAISKQYAFGPLLYLTAFVLAFVQAAASIILCFLLALFFALPGPTNRK